MRARQELFLRLCNVEDRLERLEEDLIDIKIMLNEKGENVTKK